MVNEPPEDLPALSSGGRSMNGFRESARVAARGLAMQGMVIVSVLISLASWSGAAVLFCLIE